MADLRDTLIDIAARHAERMKTDPCYAMTYRWMKEASTQAEPSKHYDRDGYCDNPARGY